MAYSGQSIEPGQIVLSDILLRRIEYPSGSIVKADFETFGAVDIAFF